MAYTSKSRAQQQAWSIHVLAIPILEQIPSPATSEQPKQRDDKGRFVSGNHGGPGNPFGRRVADMRKAMLAAVSLQVIADVFQELLAKAKTGDVQAMKLFLAYTVGKPEKVHDPDRVNVDEWEVGRRFISFSLRPSTR